MDLLTSQFLTSQFSLTGAGLIEFLMVNAGYSLLLAMLVVLIKCCYRSLPAKIEYGFWCLVLIRLVLPNDLSFEYAAANMLRSLFEFDHSGSLFEHPFIAGLFARDTFSEQLANYLAISWIVVVSVILIRYITLRVKLVRMINRSRPVVDYWPVRCANRWRSNFWIKRRVDIIAADKFLSPFTFSFVNPVIFIPREILESNNETLIESIIAHEMAHIKRQDSLWLVVQNLIQIGYFFNPLVLMIIRRLSSLRENICDQMVLQADKIDPQDYGMSLLQVLRFNISGDRESLLESHFLGHKNQIRKRVALIGQYQPAARRPAAKLAIQTAIMVTFGLFLLPLAAPQQLAVSSATKAVQSPFDQSPFPQTEKIRLRLPVVLRDNEVNPDRPK